MKRLIKYTESYNYGPKFSTCGTKYEILHAVLNDEDGLDKLQLYADNNGLTVLDRGTVENNYNRPLVVTDWLRIEDKEILVHGKPANLKQYLGLITLDTSGPLKPVSDCTGQLTLENCQRICMDQEYNISDVGEYQGGGTMLVIEGWGWYHHLPLLGYSMEQLHELMEITDEGFSDDTFRCGECGIYDHGNGGYIYNHRIVNECELLGVNCGCYDEYIKDNWTDMINTVTPIECNVAESEDALIHVQRWITGMMDPGRGGYYGGQQCDPCDDPKELFEGLVSRFPEDGFVITHDESGQFQTYFSIYAVVTNMSDELCDYVNQLKKEIIL